MRALKITQSITRRDERSLEKYLTDISQWEVLTPEEELSLFKRYRAGDEEALSRIVLHNLRFVVSVAKQYQIPGLWLGDLISEGNIGLIKAARRFDETRGFKFISYAVWWIRQSILQALNEKSRKIRLPLNVNGNTAKINAVRLSIMQKTEREATMEELMEHTGLDEHVIKRCLTSAKGCVSLDAPVQEDADASLGDLLGDDSIAMPDHEVAVVESQKNEVAQLLHSLPPRQAQVLSMYFGIDRDRAVTLSDIAEEVGVTRERARQIKDKGLRKLRKQVLRASAAGH